MLASLVPLTLLGLALLGVFGLEDVWRDSVGPAVEQRVTGPVFFGIDYTVEEIFRQESVGLVAFASLLLLWHVSRGMRIVMKALNAIHDRREDRSPARLWATDLALALVLCAALVSAFLLVTLLPRLAEGAASLGLQLAAWLGATALLGLVVGVLMRYAPTERPETGWATAGSGLVVVTWLLASLLFGWWAGSLVSYESAVGTLTAFLLLTTYVLTSTTIFLAGAQLDELARTGRRR